VVLDAVRFWSKLTDRFRACIETGDHAGAAECINANFERRKVVCRISKGNMLLVETARSVGASAKFSGSGGAIVGTYEGEDMYARLEDALGKVGASVLKPAYVYSGAKENA
jgi:glucuronokinase